MFDVKQVERECVCICVITKKREKADSDFKVSARSLSSERLKILSKLKLLISLLTFSL